MLVLIAIETVFVLGCALMLSVCNVYFRDVQHFVAILLLVLFYSAPIVYPITVVPVHAHVLGMEIPLRRLYRLNPLVRFVEAFRAVLYDLRFPPLWDTMYLMRVGGRRCSSSACGCSLASIAASPEEV